MLKRYAFAAVPKKTKLFYFLIFLFIAGVCLGAGAGNNDSIRLLADGYTAAQASEDAADNFFRSLSADAVLFIAVFLLGFSSISVPVLILVPFFKGLGVGAAVSALYLLNPSFLPILKNIAAFCITASVSSFMLIFAVREALFLSAGLFSHLRGRCDCFDLVGEGKKFGLKFLLFAVIIVINAVLDCLLSVLLYL